jgi:ABC-type transporter Mla subunit MlaD
MEGHEDGSSRRIVGVVVIVFALIAFAGLLALNRRDGAWKKQVEIVTDFRTITGLRRDSPVLLAGVEVGRVKAIDFVTRHYPCDPLTEDIGRHGDGRTNVCDEVLFCAPQEACAELESYAAKGMHSPCLGNDDCVEGEICVTDEFRKRAKGVYWGGPQGLCARYTTEHRRVEVRMTLPEESAEVIGATSIATVGSAGVLGDQQVNITPGAGAITGDPRRIQSEPSFSEQIAEFRLRFDRLADKVDGSLSGISSTFAELNDARTVEAVRETLVKWQVKTDDIMNGRGNIGALLNNPESRRNFAGTLAKARDTAAYVDGVLKDANSKLAQIDRETEPRVAELRKKVGDVRKQLDSLDPKSGSTTAKLFRDPSGELLAKAQASLVNVRTATRIFVDAAGKIERGEGSIGALLTDSKAYDALDSKVVAYGDDWRLKLLLWLLR